MQDQHQQLQPSPSFNGDRQLLPLHRDQQQEVGNCRSPPQIISSIGEGMLTPKKSEAIPDVSLFTFKSPAPSHFKQKMAAVGLPFNHHNGRDQAGSILAKSPHMISKSRFGDSTSKMMFGGGASNSLAGQYFGGASTAIANGSLDNSNKWLISPVCSRFRDHFQMANGGATINDSLQKMRKGGDSLGNAFMHSPMMTISIKALALDSQHNPVNTHPSSLWPLCSPPQQELVLSSTAQQQNKGSIQQQQQQLQHSTDISFSKNHYHPGLLQNTGYGSYSEFKENEQTSNSAGILGVEDKTDSKNAQSHIMTNLGSNPSLGRIQVSPYGAVRKFIECGDSSSYGPAHPINSHNQSDLSSGVIATSSDINLNKSHQPLETFNQANWQNPPPPTARISDLLGTTAAQTTTQNNFQQIKQQKQYQLPKQQQQMIQSQHLAQQLPQYYGDCPACQAAYLAAQAAMARSSRRQNQEQQLQQRSNMITGGQDNNDIECHEELLHHQVLPNPGVSTPHLIDDLMMQDGLINEDQITQQLQFDEEEEECDDEDCEYCRMYYLQLQNQQINNNTGSQIQVQQTYNEGQTEQKQTAQMQLPNDKSIAQGSPVEIKNNKIVLQQSAIKQTPVIVVKERGRGRPALNKGPKQQMMLVRSDAGQQDGLSPEPDIQSQQLLLRKSAAVAVPKSKMQGSILGRTSYILGDNGVYERVIRKRKRKSGDQLKTLMREFDRNPNWSKDTLLEVSRKTGLSEAQVYKWGWDQKRKKYGPEIAALMMNGQFEGFPPGFEHLAEGNEEFHKQMMLEADQEDDSDGIDGCYEDEGPYEIARDAKKNEAPLQSSSRLLDNLPPRFPNEELLEKLSNKLAEEEKESIASHAKNSNQIQNSSSHSTSLKTSVVFKIDSNDLNDVGTQKKQSANGINNSLNQSKNTSTTKKSKNLNSTEQQQEAVPKFEISSISNSNSNLNQSAATHNQKEIGHSVKVSSQAQFKTYQDNNKATAETDKKRNTKAAIKEQAKNQKNQAAASKDEVPQIQQATQHFVVTQQHQPTEQTGALQGQSVSTGKTNSIKLMTQANSTTQMAAGAQVVTQTMSTTVNSTAAAAAARKTRSSTAAQVANKENIAPKSNAAASFSSKITISNPSAATITPSKKALQNITTASEVISISQPAPATTGVSDSRKLREARVLRGKHQQGSSSAGNNGNAQTSSAIIF